MERDASARRWVGTVVAIPLLAYAPPQLPAQVMSLDPAKMPPLCTVDKRFQSYNIEMVEVMGGRFWKPYSRHGFRWLCTSMAVAGWAAMPTVAGCSSIFPACWLRSRPKATSWPQSNIV
jgi:hypothetical protein